ncbi:LytTR family DNA-binding domain-containing protein [Sporosarcina cascadiensis]|uniref:LytTR family DNA-binding domain-containing protein n=1 Tax=Sporosarcina cascadiensis TaxID=2660747 RepID=UPI00129ADD06|nr:LytTR family DNA-binding domain-containing protein [Sporosarcina cascadiensis]
MIKIRLKVNESNDFTDIEIIINCPEEDERVSPLVQQINQMMHSIYGKKDGVTYPLVSDQLLYMESVNDTVFLYTDDDVFESGKKLYELEEQLKEMRFMRISKNFIVNIAKIESVKALLNGRFEAYLINGEKVIINRHYVKSFRKHFLG